VSKDQFVYIWYGYLQVPAFILRELKFQFFAVSDALHATIVFSSLLFLVLQEVAVTARSVAKIVTSYACLASQVTVQDKDGQPFPQ
jgi:hypothetical protein